MSLAGTCRVMTTEDALYYGEGRRRRRYRVTTDDDDDDSDEDCCKRCCKKCCRCFKSSLLTLLIFISTGVGIGLGALLRFIPPFDQPKEIPREMMYLLFPGQLLIRLMTFLAIPLLVSSLVSGLSGITPTLCAKIGFRTLLYYLCTTILAVGEGIGLIYAIRPGERGVTLRETDVVQKAPTEVNLIDTLLDVFRNIVPENVVTVAFQLTATDISLVNRTMGTDTVVDSSNQMNTINANILGMMFMSILFGVAVSKLKDRGRLTFYVVDGLFEATLTLAKGIMWLYPIGIIFLLTHEVINLDDPLQQMGDLFVFILSVLLGFFAHAFIVLPVIYAIFTRRNPFKHVYKCFRAVVTGFATNDTNVTMPVTLDCLMRAGVHPSVARFVCPVGAAINLDGLAMYQVMTCIFFATLRGLSLSPIQLVSLGFTSVAVSIAAPAIGDTYHQFAILFTTIGLPLTDIYMILSFDWLLRRFRMIVNVWGDCVGAGVVEKCSKSDLRRIPYNMDTDDKSSVDLGAADGAVLTGYMPRHPRDWTVRLVNERGDRLVVSKV